MNNSLTLFTLQASGPNFPHNIPAGRAPHRSLTCQRAFVRRVGHSNETCTKYRTLVFSFIDLSIENLVIYIKIIQKI